RTSCQPFRQLLMNFLRSSPFLPSACLLQSFILFCCAVCLAEAPAVSPLRQELMNFLRSSPFLSLALALQSFILSCCAFCFSVGSFFALSCAYAGTARTAKHSNAIIFFMPASLWVES